MSRFRPRRARPLSRRDRAMIGSKGARIAGWVLSGLLAALFLASAGAKFAGGEQVKEGFSKMGLSDKITLIAAGEAISAVLFLVPLAHPLGVLLLSSYMGGAILAHMTQHESYVAQSVILVLIWVAGFLR